jgi:hypothetical protein
MKQERALWTLTKVGQEIEAQRPWVGLTDEEHNAIYKQCQGVRVGSAILLTEAKLKEKNT